MRQSLGSKKVRRLAEQTGLPVVRVMVRGNTGHRKDLCLADGRIFRLYLDGTLEEDLEIRWMPTPNLTPEP